MSLGIYVHIPFCKSKCKYCDFNSSSEYWDLEEVYTDRLVDEICSCTNKDEVDSVFIGGGTPTAIKMDNLLKVINALNTKFKIKDAEFTVECNPATIDYDGFLALKNAGVNRISIGLQSANDDELSFLGRIHTFDMFLKTYKDAILAGIENINVDLMFSLHNHTEQKWKNTLEKVVSLKPKHISCYSLIIEPGTPFYDMQLNLPDEETDRKMYYDAVDFLAENGYKRYEISNFALDGYECKHNIKYWTRKNYLGFGLGASGLYDNVRTKNSSDINEYIKNNQQQKDLLSYEDAKGEHIFLGLRLAEGFDIEEFNNIYKCDFLHDYKDVIERFCNAGLLKVDKNCYLTKEGVSVSNSIMCEFL